MRNYLCREGKKTTGAVNHGSTFESTKLVPELHDQLEEEHKQETLDFESCLEIEEESPRKVNSVHNQSYTFSVKREVYSSNYINSSKEALDSSIPKELEKIHSILRNYEPRIDNDTIIRNSRIEFFGEGGGLDSYRKNLRHNFTNSVLEPICEPREGSNDSKQKALSFVQLPTTKNEDFSPYNSPNNSPRREKTQQKVFSLASLISSKHFMR